MIANINYKGKVDQEVTRKMRFPCRKPAQVVEKTDKYTLVFFQSGSCRIMGCKKPIRPKDLKYNIQNIQLQSLTVVHNLKTMINLYELSKVIKCVYEPEIFPGLRISKYDPMCVNLFSSGKTVLVGIKTFYYQSILNEILKELINLINNLNTVV